jgi:hypothetical protein
MSLKKEILSDKKEVLKKQTPVKDYWFTFSGICKEASRVRWPKWKSVGNEAGTIQNSGEVLIFTIFFAVFFILCDLFVAFLLKTVGIGA